MIPYSLAPGMGGYRGLNPVASTMCWAVISLTLPFLSTAYFRQRRFLKKFTPQHWCEWKHAALITVYTFNTSPKMAFAYKFVHSIVLGNCPQIQNNTKQKSYSNTNFCICQRAIIGPNDCSQKVSQYIAVCIVHSSLLAWISSVHIDKVLACVVKLKNSWHFVQWIVTC